MVPRAWGTVSGRNRKIRRNIPKRRNFKSVFIILAKPSCLPSSAPSEALFHRSHKGRGPIRARPRALSWKYTPPEKEAAER